MRAMWFVSDSDSPTVATIGVPLPPVTSAIAPSAAVRSRAISSALHHRLGIVLELERGDRARRLERRERVVERLRKACEAVVVAAQHRRP